MQEKMINRFLILVLMLVLSGCSSLFSEQHNDVNVQSKETDIFVDPSISRFMGPGDQFKLQTLVATAQPQQWTKWVSETTGARFEFTSLSIYVNSQGQGCRNYKMAVNHGFLEHKAFSYNACRDSQGAWRVVKA